MIVSGKQASRAIRPARRRSVQSRRRFARDQNRFRRRPTIARARLARLFARPENGFSLLEVILAIAILAGIMVLLGEVARQGMDSARIARDLTYAQCICDSLMAELALGLIYPETVDQAPVDEICDPAQAGWVYSMEVEETEIDGLLAVRITVSQASNNQSSPVRCSLVRWIQDPDAAFGNSVVQ